MERQAFARARRYLNYSPLAKWSAILAALGSGILYIGILAVLGLFADLMVWRGSLPAFRDLSEADQRYHLQTWSQDRAPWAEKLRKTRVPDAAARLLIEADPATLRAADLELLWRGHMYHVLESKVSSDAAAFAFADVSDQAPEDAGILSLVVRSQTKPYGWFVSEMARWNPWSWSNSRYYLPGLFIIAIGLALLRALLRYAMILTAARATVTTGTRLRRAVYHHTFRLGNLAVRALGPSEAVGIFTRELEALQSGLYAWLTLAYCEPIKLILLLGFALVVNWALALVAIFFALLVWLVHEQLAAARRRQIRDAARKSAEQLALIQESLMLLRLVKAYLLELFNQSRVERQLARYERAQMRRHVSEGYRPLLIFLGTLAAAVLLGAAGLFVLNRQLGIATAITLATTLISMYWPAVSWLEYVPLRRRAYKSAVALFEFLDRKGDVGQIVGAEFLPPLTQSLEFDDVSLREPGTNRLLLQNVSLTIPAGQRVGIIGSDELEKHALIYLIPRFLDPVAGEIRVDQHNIRWVTLDSLRAQIAVVLQHNFVFNDTVANNIGCGDPSYSLPQIIEAAKMVHAHQFIQRLPQGYETQIGGLGRPLDIGVQFLIALARAVLRDPAVIIIEEPAVPLDEKTKTLLDDCFARILPDRTAIFLPHRIPTIRSCDTICLLHKGQIIAAGSHRELLETNDLYRHLHYMEFHEFVEQT